MKEIKEKKITNIQTIDFKRFFNNLYGKDSCNIKYNKNTKNKKEKYAIGDCVFIDSEKLKNQTEKRWIVLTVKNNSIKKTKSKKSNTLKKDKVNKKTKVVIKYKIVSLLKGEVYNDLVNHEDIEYQLLI